jgi:CHAD domain-containing protein
MRWRGVLATRLMRRAKHLGKVVDDAGPLYAPNRVHDVRIAIKKLRYALEIAQDARIAGAGALVRTLKRQQDRLGTLHDFEALLRHVRETGTLPNVGSRVNDLTAYADSLERDCRRFHAIFVEHRAELTDCVKQVRLQVVPALTTAPRRQAKVTAPRGVRLKPVSARIHARARTK